MKIFRGAKACGKVFAELSAGLAAGLRWRMEFCGVAEGPFRGVFRNGECGGTFPGVAEKRDADPFVSGEEPFSEDRRKSRFSALAAGRKE